MPHRSLDSLVAFSKMTGSSSASGSAPVRYAVRQVLDQEYRKEMMRKQSDAKNAAGGKSLNGQSVKEQQGGASHKVTGDAALKRDFFGRVIQEPIGETKETESGNHSDETSKAGRKVWVTYHEGFSNAVRKPISLGELLAGL
jgi:chromosome transmission fidelity protein 18